MHRHQAKVMTTPFFWNDAIIRVLMLRLGIRPEALALLVWGEVHECNSAGPKFVARGHMRELLSYCGVVGPQGGGLA